MGESKEWHIQLNGHSTEIKCNSEQIKLTTMEDVKREFDDFKVTPPLNFDTIRSELEGWLEKKGRSGMFHPRYFTLRRNYLAYAHAPEKPEAGCFDLKEMSLTQPGCYLEPGDHEHRRIRLMFTGGTEMLLRAQSCDKALEWRHAMERHVGVIAQGTGKASCSKGGYAGDSAAQRTARLR